MADGWYRRIKSSPEFSRGTIRISLGAENTIEEMEYVADKIKELVGNLREFSEEYLELQEKGFV